jgi:4-amino-4-deoxy-L-arabinose transferase-like glycosyltransferase
MKGKYFFFAGLLLIIGLRLSFVLFLPEGQRVKHHLEGLGDEPAHFNYIKYLVKNRSFPIQTTTYKTPGASIRNDFEFYQPPVYYLIGALGLRLGGGLHFCRMLSCICGILSLWFVALILKRMGTPCEVQAAGVLLCGLFPPHAYFSSVVSNDSMSWLVALALTYAFLGQGRESGSLVPEFTWRRSLIIGFLLGAGSLIKSSLLLFYPIAAGCFFYAWYRQKDGMILLRTALSLGCAGLVNVPWLLRNYAMYHSFTGLSFLNGPEVSYPHLLTLQGFPLFLKTSVRYFWFPMQHIPISLFHKGLGMIGACILIALFLTATSCLSEFFRWFSPLM